MTNPAQQRATGSGAKTVLVVNLFDKRTRAEWPKAPHYRDDQAGMRIHELIPSLPPSELEPKDRAVYSILRSIEAYAKEHGTVAELRLSGHGSSLRMLGRDHDDSNIKIDLQDLTRRLNLLQDTLGIKIADKIHFSGCTTFTDPMPSDTVAFFRNASVSLGSEIIGATTFGMDVSVSLPIGVFLPDAYAMIASSISGSKIMGTATPPRIDFYYTDALISFRDGNVGKFTKGEAYHFDSFVTIPVLNALTGTSSSWIGCHEGKTQEEGAVCQADLAKARAEAKAALAEALRNPGDALHPFNPLLGIVPRARRID